MDAATSTAASAAGRPPEQDLFESSGGAANGRGPLDELSAATGSASATAAATATNLLQVQLDRFSRQREQSLGEWWAEYWARQPFPSGYTQSSITLLACFISTIIFLIVVGNLLVCIAIFTEKSLKPTQNWFIASLAVSDLLLGLIVMPFSLARELMGFWVFGSLWCDIHEAVDVLLTTASINTLCLISLDRYWSITQAVKYLKKRTPRRGAMMIAFVWIFSAAVSLPPLFGWKKQQTPLLLNVPATNDTQTGAPETPQEGQPSGPEGGAAESDEGRRKRSKRHKTQFELGPGGNRSMLARRVDAELPANFVQLLAANELQIGASLDFATIDPTRTATTASAAARPSSATATTTATEYPTCSLSDDVGYVLYSALGSFYLPCAVMVFTYIRIFLAARKRARRAISKQSRPGEKAAKRAAAASRAANLRAQQSGASSTQQPAQNQTSSTAATVTGSAVAKAAEQPLESAPIGKGKLVVVERRKSCAAPARGAAAEEADKAEGVAAAAAELAAPAAACVLTTSGAKQASQSALDGCATNASTSNESSSMITVISATIGDSLPVTRFNFRRDEQAGESNAKAASEPETEPASREGLQRAASLLEAIKQVAEQVEEKALEEILAAGGERQSSTTTTKTVAPPNIVAEVCTNPNAAEPHLLASSTNETCFMTIEEDSDTYDAQTGRTIMMVAANAKQSQGSLAARAANFAGGNTMLMMQPAAAALGAASSDDSPNQPAVCSNAACLRRHQNGPRSGSSYWSSTMTIYDDDDDDDDDDDVDDEDIVDEEDEEEDDGDDVVHCDGHGECGASSGDAPLDDELTDDCNGYSGASCALGQYCPAAAESASSCVHCNECAAEAAAGERLRRQRRTARKGARDSPGRVAADRKLQRANCGPGAQLQLAAANSETELTTADDNLSLTEYRSNEESSSQTCGADILTATAGKPTRRPSSQQQQQQVAPGRKKSSIGLRFARFASSGSQDAQQQQTQLSSQSGGLLALAASQHNQSQQIASGPTRNLKALRQNFFHKLNQLTAKSAAKQNKSDKLSSAQSSGSSYEQSVDYATTSNVHSLNDVQDTTMAETDFEPPQSSVAAQADVASSQLALVPVRPGGHLAAAAQRLPTKSLGVASTPSAGSQRPCAFAGGRNEQLLDVRGAADDLDLGSASNKSLRLDLGGGSLTSRATSGSIVAPLSICAKRAPNAEFGLSGSGRVGASGGSKAAAAARAAAGGSKAAATSLGSTTTAPGSGRAYLAQDNERHKRKLAKARERRATLILGLIMAAFVCSWMPFFSFYVLRAVCHTCRDYISPRFEATIFWMGYCNSAINPIIYTIFNRDFRKAFRKILFKCI